MKASAAVGSVRERSGIVGRRLSEVVRALGWPVVAACAGIVVLLGVLVGQAQGGLLMALVCAVLVVALLAVVVALFHRRVLGPVAALTDDTERAAHVGLPGAVATLEADGTPTLAPITTRGSAPVAALAAAITSLQGGAVSVATAQHVRHREAVDVMGHLGRRNHGLVDRLVTQIGESETGAHNPSALAALSRLGRTATRIRRHAENVLLLTGAVPDRHGARPAAAVVDVLRGSLAGIEDHVRVDIRDVEPAAVAGSAVGELAHLVAELVENATHFSPPETRVVVAGSATGDGYRIRITDRGVGMTAAQLDGANGRLRSASGGPASRLIGLDVVGRLAAQQGLTVVLTRGTPEGIVATVTVPRRLLARLTELPAPRRPVSALVAAAAFLPPRSSAIPEPRKPVDPPAAPAATVAPTFVRPGVPRRVRGAQLPELGPEGDGGPHVVPDAGRVQGRLNSLQAGLFAARTNNIPPLPRPVASADRPPADG